MFVECVCFVSAASACCPLRLLCQRLQSTIRLCQDAPAEDDTQPRRQHALQGPSRLRHADLQERGTPQVLHWLPHIPCPVSNLVCDMVCMCSCSSSVCQQLCTTAAGGRQGNECSSIWCTRLDGIQATSKCEQEEATVAGTATTRGVGDSVYGLGTSPCMSPAPASFLASLSCTLQHCAPRGVHAYVLGRSAQDPEAVRPVKPPTCEAPTPWPGNKAA